MNSCTRLRGLAIRTRAMLRDESGQTLLEYALITALVSIVGITLLSVIGGTTANFLVSIKNAF
jgi:Flp pilus assembly pilin Flp